MEYTQKMYLVPQQQLDRLKQQQQDANVSIRRAAQTELDKEMSEVLDSEDVNMSEKAKKYSKILQRYLSLVKQEASEKSTLTLSMPHVQTSDVGVTAEFDSGGNADVEESILKYIPRRSKTNAGHILDALRRAPGKVSWTKSGEVIINGQNIRGSHVFDLIKNVTSSHNVSVKPPGWEMFLKTLAELNVPLSIVPNMKVRDTISGFKTGFDSQSDTSIEGEHVVRQKKKEKSIVLSPNFSTPLKTPTAVGRKKNNWTDF